MLSERSKETWKPIIGNEDYVISNYGRIKRVKRLGINGVVGRILKPQADPNGYAKVFLRSQDGCGRKYRVHRLVLETFIGSCPEGFEPNHKDGNKLNNCINNLEWVTHSGNIKHAYDIGKLRRKLTASQVNEIRSRSDERQVDLASEFGVRPGTIYEILHYISRC